MQGTRLNLIVIRAADIEASAAFYSALGLTFIKERHGTGPEHYACEQGGLVFEIYPAKKDAGGGATVRLGFEVASLERAIADVGRLEARLVSPPTDSPWGRRATVADPDGHKVDLAERTV